MSVEEVADEQRVQLACEVAPEEAHHLLGACALVVRGWA
jgi:hypothetical protein